jgi:hypothetical protein
VHQLRASVSNWNEVFGSVAQLNDFHLLGVCTTKRQCESVSQWILSNGIFPVGNIDYPDRVELHTVSDATDDSANFIRELIAGLITVGDLVLTLHWMRADGSEFKTLTIANDAGIQYDSLLSSVALSARVDHVSDERHTDCEHIRIGWIWQRNYKDMTRGQIDLCLSAECGPAGDVVRCPEATKFMFMQLGSVDGDVQYIHREGNCCVGLCAWAWATATITVKVKAKYGGLEIEVSGGLGTVGKGGRELKDCCPKRSDFPPQPESGPPAEHPHTQEKVAGPTTVTPGADGTTVVTLPDGTVIINNPGGPIVVVPPGEKPQVHWPPDAARPLKPDGAAHLPHRGLVTYGRRPECREEFEVRGGGYGDSKTEAARNAEENADYEASLLCPVGCRPPKKLRWVLGECDHAPGMQWYCTGTGFYRCPPP